MSSFSPGGSSIHSLPCLLQPQSHKPQPARKLPPKKDMKEQEKGDGSDSKESPKTKSDESGEEKNGDDDCQRGGQKKKGKFLLRQDLGAVAYRIFK